MKIKSDSVSFHQKKISFCSDSDLRQNQIRTENPDSCDQSTLTYYIVKITEEFLTSQHDEYYYTDHKQSF